MDVHGEFSSITPLQSVGDPYDPYVLQKAALLATGVIPASGGDLETVLNRLGGGIWIDTEVVDVPKGSGLGTSSILAAACVKGIFEFLDIAYTEDDLYSTVLCMEQIMSTGGGWQDQVGGVTDGIKYITSRSGLKQEIKVQHVVLDKKTWDELNKRFCLIYTGQRRLARNLLRDVVGRYIGNEPDAVYALNEIQRNATLQRFELERGNVDAFAELLSRHWELSKLLDEGSTNTLIDQIFDACDDLLVGKMICGAGGGGFLQVVLRSGVEKSDLQARLKSIFSDTDIGVWDCELV
jgi:fucokinase